MADSDRSFSILAPAPGPDDPLGLLRACHQRIIDRLESLARVLKVYEQGEEPRYAEAAQAISAAIRHFLGPVRIHTEDEEASLFPRMAAVDPAVRQVLESLESEHIRLDRAWAGLLPQLRALAEGTRPTPERTRALAAALAEFDLAYRTHLAREEAELFPRAAELVGTKSLAAIGAEMVARRDRGG